MMHNILTPETIRLLLIILATLSAHFFASRALNRAAALAAHTDNLWDDAIIAAARKPLPMLIWLSGLAFVLHLVHKQTGEQLLEYLAPARNLGFIICIAWFLFKLIRELADNVIAKRLQNGAGADRTTVDGLSKISRIAVFVVSILMVMQTLGFSVSGVLAFGGVGGIAVGFAAKDLLANLFGGLMVHLDRPFNIGDKIRSPDKQIEGQVEHIGWRQTSLRGANMAMLYVPNALFTSIIVENVTRMSHKRIQETIALRYQDLSKVSAIIDDIKAMLNAHPNIDTSENLLVAFNQLADSSANIALLANTRSTSLLEYHQVKQDILFKVADIVAAHGADFAFPTHTLHINQSA